MIHQTLSHACSQHPGSHPDYRTDADREEIQLRIFSEEDVVGGGGKKRKTLAVGRFAVCCIHYLAGGKKENDTKQALLADIQSE